jgi:hypothetical protein
VGRICLRRDGFGPVRRATRPGSRATPALSYAEIAELFDMPIGSIGPTRARCLQRLRGLHGERGITGIAEDS